MLAKTFAGAVSGVNAQTITIEVNAGGTPESGKQFWFMVGLPDKSVREGFHRIEAAIRNINIKLPHLKMVVNLAPANIPKEGSAYDLPVALGMLAAANVMIGDRLKDYLIMGELALDGGLRPIRGALPIAILARNKKYKGIILPRQNAEEAAIVSEVEVHGIDNLQEAVDFFNGAAPLHTTEVDTRDRFAVEHNQYDIDFSDVISRAKVTVDYPASFMLIASMNPCPCGYHNHPEKDCVCGPGVVQRYVNKISGPLLDRIDLHAWNPKEWNY